MANGFYGVLSSKKSDDVITCKNMIEDFFYESFTYPGSIQRVYDSSYLFLIKHNSKTIGFISACKSEDSNIITLDLCIDKKFRCKKYLQKNNKVLRSCVNEIINNPFYNDEYITINLSNSHIEVTFGTVVNNTILLHGNVDKFISSYPNGIETAYKVIGARRLYSNQTKGMNK